MVATKTRFASEGERGLYQSLVKFYGPDKVQGHVRLGDVVSLEGLGLTDAEQRYLRLAHFDFIVWDSAERAIAAWEYDGAQHITDAQQQRRDRLKDSICGKGGCRCTASQAGLLPVPFGAWPGIRENADPRFASGAWWACWAPPTMPAGPM